MLKLVAVMAASTSKCVVNEWSVFDSIAKKSKHIIKYLRSENYEECSYESHKRVLGCQSEKTHIRLQKRSRRLIHGGSRAQETHARNDSMLPNHGKLGTPDF